MESLHPPRMPLLWPISHLPSTCASAPLTRPAISSHLCTTTMRGFLRLHALAQQRNTQMPTGTRTSTPNAVPTSSRPCLQQTRLTKLWQVQTTAPYSLYDFTCYHSCSYSHHQRNAQPCSSSTPLHPGTYAGPYHVSATSTRLSSLSLACMQRQHHSLLLAPCVHPARGNEPCQQHP